MKKVIFTIAGVLIGIALAFLVVAWLAQVDFHGQRSEIVEAPPEKIWNYLTDIEGNAERRPEITRVEILSPNSIGLPQWKEYTDMGGFILFEQLEAKPFEKLVIRMNASSFGMMGVWTYEMIGSSSATSVTISESSSIQNFFVRGLLTLIGRDANLEQEFRYMKEAVEPRMAR